MFLIQASITNWGLKMTHSNRTWSLVLEVSVSQ